MIEVRHLTKRYGPRAAVSDLSFEVGKGEVAGFLGPNGAGKSTTLRMLTGFLEPSEGSIRIAGLDALRDGLEVRRRIGYMPEAVPLYLEMRVREYLAFRAELKGVPRKLRARNIDRALEQAAVSDVRQRVIGQLSKGYRQRVGLADALVADPPLLILDEPTAGLDPNQIRQVRELIRALTADKTILLSTHILPEVEASCGKVIIIDRGRLVSVGGPEELRSGGQGVRALVIEARCDEARLRKALAAVAAVRSEPRLTALGGDAEVWRARVEIDAAELDVAAEAVARALADASIALRELRREDRSLEEVFTRLTTQDAAAEEDAA